MKKLMLALMLSSLSFASSVKITSFAKINPTNYNDRAAEVCGYIVDEDEGARLLKITADPDSKNPGVYWTHAAGQGPKKLFCHVITIYGTTVMVELGDLKVSRSL